jgi:hypothetical protein
LITEAAIDLYREKEVKRRRKSSSVQSNRTSMIGGTENSEAKVEEEEPGLSVNE